MKQLSKFRVAEDLKCYYIFMNEVKKNPYLTFREVYQNISKTIGRSTENFDDDYKTLYIGFTELSPTFDDTCFKLVGKNLEKLKDNKNVDKIKIGEKITFITAPKYFGDGYVMPIVQISINGECLLEFNEGYTNFLGWLSNKEL